MTLSRSASFRWFAVAGIISMVAWWLGLPATRAQSTRLSSDRQSRLSQSALVHYWLANPDQAPPSFQPRARAKLATQAAARAPQAVEADPVDDRFNQDIFGLPQNEESVVSCRSRPEIVLGGTNDYRGLLDPEQNFTGWHLSTNGGDSVANEGLLPPIEVSVDDPYPVPIRLPSGGDPVVAADANCNLYAGSLNLDPLDPFNNTSAISVYRSRVATLTSCDGGTDPACWPTRKAVAISKPGHFLDKEWLDVGQSGSAGNVVWVTYTDFNFFGDPSDLPSAIYAVRCTAALTGCSKPILISGDDRDVQFSDVTIGPDGRTYITWVELIPAPGSSSQTFVVKMRVAPAGSTTFGRERVVRIEGQPIPFGGFLQANDFRAATYPKNAVTRLANGTARIFVVWEACTARVLAESVCEEPRILLKYSDDQGATWSGTKTLSIGGSNYFVTISADQSTGSLAVAWFTSRQDTIFGNRQDVELVTVEAATASVTKRQIITSVSNEPEADPYLGGFFIGDYIEVFAHEGTAYVHYNANYKKLRFVGDGVPVAQQDNYLTKASLAP
jgi:hypothetical protein